MDGHHSPGPTSGLPSHARAKSTSSTAASYPLTIPPNAVSPEPAFIDASAAAQIVTNDYDSHADAWYDQNGVEPSGAPVQVSDGALRLLNGFLDQLLLNFLKASASTNLSDLRPAIAGILKPNLASDVMDNAEKDLVACKITRAEAEYVQPIDNAKSRTRDVELIWKRMRLRCMVYSSLGDVEDEDAAMYMKQEHLEVGGDSQLSDLISPAVAIFMTSVIEYMGELTLTVAGQAAYHRVRCDIERGLREGSRRPGDMADQTVVGEADMERVALDMTLGRLWRGWKKRLRSRITDIPRPMSQITPSHSQHSNLASPRSDTNTLSPGPQEYVEEVIVEPAQPFDIPLPMGPCDVGEIEVPGLVNYSDEESEAEDQLSSSRPKSSYAEIPERRAWNAAGKRLYAEGLATKPRRRSSSMPHTTRPPLFSVLIPGEGTTKMHVPAQESEREPNEQELVSDLSDQDVPRKHPSRRLAPIGLGLTTPGTQINRTSKKTAVADDVSWDSDGPEEVATLEKAEVIISSRVSVDSSPSSSCSESPKKGHKRSTSSMHSARIIDVQAPKSPTTYSRQGTLENAHAHAHARTANLSVGAAFTGAAVVAGATGAALATKSFHDSSPVEKSPSSPLAPYSRTQIERATPTVRNAGTSSKSEDGADYHTAPGNSEAPAAVATSGNVVTRRNRNAKSPMTLDVEKATRDAFGTREPLSPRLVNTSYDGKPSPNPAMIGEARSPVHSASPRNLHGFRDNKAPGTLEKLGAEEEEEEFSTPLHSVGPARTIHTSGSSGSSATGRMKVVRSSEENSSTGRSGSVVRNFEELIQSNQTITYTLTPESMRHADSSKPALDSPVVTKFPRRSEDARAPNNLQPSPTTSVSPSTFRGQGPEVSTTAIPEVKAYGPIPRAPAGIAITTGRTDGPQAREARVPSETTSDFAQFIKSTGPAPEDKQLPRLPSNDKPGLSGPGPVPRAPESARRASTISNKSRFQPREPVTGKNDTRDLIDFIRQGPPIAASNHRIPRHVAPFRTTMDSDQLAGMPGGKAVDANIPDLRYSQGSTNVTENSMQSSLNSNSALLRGKGGNSKIASMFAEDDMPMPQRKTRRVRDPYAIDVSDEEEEEDDDEDVLAAAPAPPVKAKREESLAEFLRNYNPPAEPAATTRHIPKKKASAPSLIGRFTRNNAAKDAASMASMTPMASVEARSLNSRASHRGHIPIQINMPPGYDKYGAIETQSTGRPRISSTSGTSGRVPMKKFEPREPREPRERAGDTFRGETSDLAAFLRNSGPPEPPPMQQARAEEPSSGLSRMFGRRKRTPA